MLPSLKVMGIATADPALFESLMARAGFRIVPRDNDPLSTNVQEEAVAAVASAITEDTYHGVRLNPYQRQLKTLAERAGYVVVVENCGPPGADPCAGDDMMGGMEGAVAVEVGVEGDDMMGSVGGPESGPEVGPVEGEMGGNDAEIQRIASLPIGTDLAREMLAVLSGGGTDAMMGDDEFGGDEGLHGEMPIGGGDETGGEVGQEGGEEFGPGPEAGDEQGPGPEANFGPEEGVEGEEEEGRPY